LLRKRKIGDVHPVNNEIFHREVITFSINLLKGGSK
jgi:hypothetical protein